MAQFIEAIEKANTQDIEQDEHYKKLVENLESGALKFQQTLRDLYTGPKPVPETIKFSLADYVHSLEETSIAPPEDLDTRHPSYIAMAHMRDENAIQIYRMLDLPDSTTIDDKQILSRYDRRLDMFFLASYVYGLRRRSLRESPERHDMQDLLHTTYIYDNHTIIVSDDKLFEQVLPPGNRMSVAAFRAFQLGRAAAVVGNISSVQKSAVEHIAQEPVAGTE